MKNRILRIGLVLLTLIAMVGSYPRQIVAEGNSLSAVPSIQTISPGGTFDVAIKINTDVQVRGAQFVVTWDHTKVECSSVTRGTFFSAFAEAHDGDAINTPGSPQIDNTVGRFPKNISTTGTTIVMQSLSGCTGPANELFGPTGTGDLYILHMTALSGASGILDFTLANTKMVDNTEDVATLPSTAINGQITITDPSTTLPTTTPPTTTPPTTTPPTTTPPTTTPPTTTPPTTTPPTTTPPTTTPPTTTPPTTTPPTTTPPTTTPPAAATGVRRATVRPTTTAADNPAAASRTTISNGATASQSLDIAGSIDAAGLFLEKCSGVLNYGGKPIQVEIKNGTRGIQSDGSPLTEISIGAPAAAPVTPADARFINYFELEPSGAIFSNPIQISLSYDAAQIASGEDANNITVVYFNPETGNWEDCDYTLDTQNRLIRANLSHFSLYGVILKNQAGMLGASTSVAGFGWSTAGTIILIELLIGCLIVYLMLRRKQQLVLATAAAAPPMAYAQAAVETPSITDSPSSREAGPVIWDDILRDSKERGAPFKTQLEIIGGKIIIPRDGESTDIELINMPDSRVLIALEYDPEVSPRGKAKIVVLGTSKVYEKSKETR